MNPEKENIPLQGNEQKEEKEAISPKKFLFIDDNGSLLKSWGRRFREPNVVFAECHSVEEALAAVAENQPDIIFLDHQLTEHGNEGLEIARQLAGREIYSTTSDDNLAEEYEKLGISHVNKIDLDSIRAIIEGNPSEQKDEKKE